MNPCPKPKTHRDKYYTDVWLRKQHCCACGNPPVNRYRDVMAAHKGGGTAKKGPDKEAVPLCYDCHREEHRGYVTFWDKVFMGDGPNAGKTRQQIAEEHWERYQNER